ncbi:hypothetical protein AB1Y20_002242 [Prymnesium parvum]|uniref:DNA-directed RNA polymerase III subunit RPC4 n=1 Tax=Prymnesium parvum TaxID=97485 RepID=A0AB34J8D9_PRYPA
MKWTSSVHSDTSISTSMASGSGGAPPRKTLGGVQRQVFAPNVNARRNKKQADPTSALDKLLNAEEQHFERAEHRKPQPKRELKELKDRGESSKGRAVEHEPPAAGPSKSTQGSARATASERPAVLQIPSSHAANEAAAAAQALSDPSGTHSAMDVDQDDVSSLGRSDMQASSAWLYEPDAPFVLPLKAPFRSSSTNPSALPSRATSRPSSRPPSRADAIPRALTPPSRRPPSTLSHGSSPSSKAFPRASGAAALLGARQLADTQLDRFTLFQLPMNLPIRKDGSCATPAEYLDALTHSGSGSSLIPTSAGPPPGPPRPSGKSTATAAASSADSVVDDPAKKLASFADLEEGELGTLRVHRSGKLSLQIGQFLLDVEPGTACSFEQTVVAMGMPNAAGAEMAIHQLGRLEGRMVATPNLDHLLDATSGAASRR